MSRPVARTAAALGAFALTACGVGISSTPTPTPEPAASATGEPGSAAAPASNLTAGCVTDFDPDVDYFPDKASFEEASNVNVEYHGNYKVVEVGIPYAEPGTPPFTVVLVQCGTPAPELPGDLGSAQVIEVPVDDVVTMTTVNLPHFGALDAVDRLAGIGTADYVTSPEVLAAVDAGQVDEFADPSGAPLVEQLIAAAPGLLVIDAFGETLLDDVSGYVDAGVPTVLNADFIETTPLGRAEWVKFTALFLNREGEADRVYGDVAVSYEQTAAAVADVDDRPKVLLDQPFEGTWYVPGGDSFVAQMVADAGGDYAFAEEHQAGALSLDIETVLARAQDADVWIGAGSVNGSLADLRAADDRFSQFDAFASGDVWALDAGTRPTGGNPLYEAGVMRPDLILGDLAAILHPDRFPDHEFAFYGPVPEDS